MTTYIVTRKTDGQEVYRYAADTPVPWDGFPFAEFDHSALTDAPPPAPTGPRRLSKLDYMNRFTDVELAGIYTAAKVSAAVEVWLAKFNAATPDADGLCVDLDDPRTVQGLQVMEIAGLLASGRAQEILNG